MLSSSIFKNPGISVFPKRVANRAHQAFCSLFRQTINKKKKAKEKSGGQEHVLARIAVARNVSQGSRTQGVQAILH
jgi:hypothetical protein